MDYFEFGGEFLKGALWKYTIARALAIVGVVIVVVGGSVILAFAEVDDESFGTGVGIAVALGIALLLGGFVMYRDERRVAQNNAGKHTSEPPASRTLDTQLREFIEDGRRLRDRRPKQDGNLPRAAVESWERRIDLFLFNNFGSDYSDKFQRLASQPARDFTGTITSDGAEMWNRIRPLLEWLEGLEHEMRETPLSSGTPASPPTGKL